MILQIIGRRKERITSKKNGNSYYVISMIEKSPDWYGLNPNTYFITDEVMHEVKIETDNGEIFLPDGKKYMFDADFNSRGFLVGGRIYND